MKNTPLIILFFALSLLINGCKKDTTVVTEDKPAVTNTINFKLDGTDKTMASVSGSRTVSGSTQMVTITGASGADNISITIGDAKVGTIDISPSFNAFVYYSLASTYYYMVSSGTITITYLSNDLVVGKFNFIGTERTNGTTKTITAGTFNCALK